MKTHTLDTIKALCTVDGSCWIWPATSSNAAGRPKPPTVKHQGKKTYVRRLARALADGRPVQRNLDVMADCGNKRCVSPECSFKATGARRRQINIERGLHFNAATQAKAVAIQRARSKFSEELIERARTSTGSHRQVGAALGMHPTTVHYVRKGVLRSSPSNPFADLYRRNEAA